jgi:hypothetical protein
MKENEKSFDPSELGYEVFALHLLLTAPTDLAKAWAEGKTEQESDDAVQRELAGLGLTQEAEALLLKSARRFWVVRNVFRGVGQGVGKDMYSGSEPHPSRKEAIAIIAKLQGMK